MKPRLFFGAAAKVVLLALLGVAGERLTEAKSISVPPPAAEGTEIATLEIMAPKGNEGERIFAGLKRDGRLVARGEGTVVTNGPTAVVLRTLDRSVELRNGPHELWLAIDRDNLEACHPSFGDLWLHDAWQWPKSERTVAYNDPGAWKTKTLSSPENLVTIHYHRYDEDYEDVGIWTWDGNYKKSPKQNELFEVGRDELGLVFQLDRSEYGTDKIGLLPRLHADWNNKDGEDKFWRPEMGNEIFLIGGQKKIFPEKPDVSPHVVVAHIDALDQVIVQVSRPLRDASVGVKITDQDSKDVPVASAELVGTGKRRISNNLAVKLAQPLELADHQYRVSVDGFASSAPALPRAVLDDPELFCDRTAVLGATYTREATTFRVFAPTATKVNLVLYDDATGSAGRRSLSMSQAGKGIWEARVTGDLASKFYVFQLDDEDREVLDIYAVNAVDSSQRARITDMPGTGKVPAGPRVASPVDMVVYEIHVRDFTIATNSPAKPAHRGKYLGFAEAADHLKELGVTHVQLLPIQDFENDEHSTNYNWGYVTTAFNSPEGWYATDPNDDSRVREFKQLVAALHERGIGVIMDVVYNHTSNSAPFNSLVPRYYFRFLPDGSYANGSGCGNEFRSEAPMARKYILDTLKHWVTEYGVDGFRFDLMALIDLDTMKEIDRELRALRPDIVLYGEPWGGGPSSPMKKPTNKQTITGTKLGAFNDDFRNGIIGSPFDRAHGAFLQEGTGRDGVQRSLEGQWRNWSDGPYQVINYLSCHDNYVMFDKLKASKPGASDADVIEMMKLGYLLLFTAQGVPFIHGGEEFARNKQGHENSYNAPDKINEVDWSLKEKHRDLFNYVRDLIALRKAHSVFRLRTKKQIEDVLKFSDTGDSHVIVAAYDAGKVEGELWQKALVIANASDAGTADVKLPAGGVWRIAFDQTGAVTGKDRTVEGTVAVGHKSGLILFQ